MIRSQLYGSLITGLAFFGASLAWDAEAGGGKLEKSDSKVKATATATKAGADGKQTVTITLDVVKGWHLYANPVNNEILDGNQTTVKIAAKEKIKLTVKYPAGKTITDKKEKYDIYEGVVKIQADVVRTMGDSSPLEITIAVSACDSKVCLQPGTLKLKVP
jgi:DsbC/DsbD-like thiol-disulfide interchange protein